MRKTIKNIFTMTNGEIVEIISYTNHFTVLEKRGYMQVDENTRLYVRHIVSHKWYEIGDED